LCVVSASSGRMSLTGSAAEDMDRKAGTIDLTFGRYCFIINCLAKKMLFNIDLREENLQSAEKQCH